MYLFEAGLGEQECFKIEKAVEKLIEEEDRKVY